MCRLRSLVAICFAVLLAGCAGGPQTQPPTLNLRRLSDQETPLALAVRLLDQVSDVHERIEIANRIAEAYISQGISGDAGVVLDHAAALARFADLSPQSIVAAAETSRLYSRIGRSADAVALLQILLDQALAIPAAAERGRALEAVIAAAFVAGEDAFDLLGPAVEGLFVLEDLWVRAQLLISTALLYHDAGNRGTMHALMQQAIPAAGSIANPWMRAAAISQLAAAWETAGNRDAAISTIDEAMEEVRRLGNGAAPPDDAQYLLRVVQNVVLLAQQLSAVELLDRLEQPEQRVRGLSAVAASYGEQQARSAAYIFFSRAVREASLVETPAARVRAMTEVAGGYLQVGDADLAVIQANGAGSVVLQIADETAKAESGARVAAIYAAAGELPRAYQFLSDLPAGTVRDSVSIALARALVEHGRAGDALSLLRAAFSDRTAPASRSPQTAGLAGDLALAFAYAGDTTPALEWVAATGRAADAARVLAVLGGHGIGANQLTETDREALERLRSEFAAR